MQDVVGSEAVLGRVALAQGAKLATQGTPGNLAGEKDTYFPHMSSNEAMAAAAVSGETRH